MKQKYAIVIIAAAIPIALACQSSSPSSKDSGQTDNTLDSEASDTEANETREDSETQTNGQNSDNTSTDGDTGTESGTDPSAIEVEPEPIESVDEAPCKPGETAACAEVDPGFPHGEAVCSGDGVWTFEDCYYGDQDAPVAGVIEPLESTKIRYLLDGSKIEDQMYIAAHSMDVLPKAVFRGHVNDTVFPPPGSGVNMTYGWHMPVEGGGGGGQVLILQYTNKGMMPASPMVQMIFLTDELIPGAYSVGEDVAASVIALDNKTQSQCVLAVAYGGSVIVSEAENTSKKQGGSLTFRIPHPINLYTPQETTFGDLSDGFEGIEACE